MRSDAFRSLAGWRWPLYAISMTIVCVVCLGHLAHHPIDIDDDSYFSDSADVLAGSLDFFSPQKKFRGRPFTEFILLVTYAAVGGNPSVLHIIVVCLHLLTSLLLCHLAIRMGNSQWVGMGAGFLFLISVSHFRAVFWISAVAYPLSLALGIVSILAYLLFDKSKKKKWLLLFYAVSLLAAMSHIAAVTVWFFCVFLALQKRESQLFYQILPLGVLLGALALFFVHFYSGTPQISQAARVPSLVDMVQNALWFWSRLFTTAFWIPLPLYLRQSWELFVGGLACALIALPALRRDITQLRWSFWILAATAPFITISSDFLDSIASGPSRYLYWSNAGFCIALSCYFCRGIKWVAVQSKPTAIALTVCVTVTLFAASANAFRIAEYSSFYTAGRNGLALTRYDRGTYWLQRARLGRENVVPLEDTYSRLGMILLSERSRLDEVLNEGLDRYPESFSLNVYRMVIDSMNPQRADDREWKQLLSYREIGDYAEIVGMAYFNIGRGLADLEDRAGAIEAYRRSLFFRPDHSQVLERLGALLIADGQIEEGLNRLQRAVDLAPYHGGYRYSLALALQFANRTEEAIQACHQGLEIKATSELYYLLGGCLGHLGKKKEAAAVFRRGLQIFSNDRALLLGLAKAEEGHG